MANTFSPTFVAEAFGIDPHSVAMPKPVTEFTDVVIDSRALVPGSLFVALKGDRFDGHDFLEQAVAKGATGLVVAEGTKNVPKGVACFPVPDTLAALRQLAGRWRQRFTIPVIAVAGSVGKTTTKELLAAALRGRYKKVKKTEASQNGFLGVALTLLRLRDGDEAIVVEIGIDAPGAMQQHLEIVRPQASVVTTIAEEHLETLFDMETVAHEEGIALTWVAAAGGVVALNVDDPWLTPLTTHGKLPAAIRYTLAERFPNNGLRCLWGRLDRAARTLHVDGLNDREAFFPIPLPGDHNARNLLAAVAVAHGLGLSETQIRSGLATFEPPQGRSEVRQLESGIHVVCDWYNASPASTKAALEMLTQISKARGGSAWACLADMLELGPNEAALHASLADAVLTSRAGHVLLTGPRMRSLFEELQKRAMPGQLAWFETAEALGKELAAGARRGDVVLIKGSRGMKMEQLLTFLEPRSN